MGPGSRVDLYPSHLPLTLWLLFQDPSEIILIVYVLLLLSKDYMWLYKTTSSL